ncbi:MAG: hypothetical protein RJA19_1684, partial [Bacteroidota bacterium]
MVQHPFSSGSSNKPLSRWKWQGIGARWRVALLLALGLFAGLGVELHAQVVFGCTNATACNYNAAANAEDGSCLFTDCNGVCGGSATVTACGCTGGNTGLVAGYCVGCMTPSACNYDADATQAGTCLTNDCNGVCGGSAFTNSCGCVGGNTGVDPALCVDGTLCSQDNALGSEYF